ncbi:FHA domain-containing serine/threonine-protein kinase [Symmachiella dynata]|uniref:FHA domain-containing serine/threonine-protein kinase n=1 Tax=Symmachiella dynata TaxID=2527995 RepID=UPI0030EBBA14
MASQLLTNSFLELLEKSELLPPAQFNAVVRKFKLQEMPSGFEAAKTLVLNGVLSRFQADRLMQGRYRGFFIGNFKVLEILGVGGMGWVYTAEDLQSGRIVALKVLSEHHQHIVDMQARMKLEVRAGQKLDHPNIVHAYKAEHTGDVDFLVTEYVEGINLQEWSDLAGPTPFPQACDFICQAAAGLQHAHSNGLVHRDIKPSNLVVDKSGAVKILDFGLALTRNDEDEFSLAMIFGHDCLGTDDFIPPEQARESYAVDSRADLYSLGCTLYFLLSGRVPFPLKTTPEKLRAHLSKTPQPIGELVPSLPEPVIAAVEKLMAKDPGERFQSAAEVKAALEPFAERKLIPFDFPAILVERCKDAQRRVSALKQRRRKIAEASSSSSMARRMMLDSSNQHLQAGVDTGVPGETRPRRSAVSLVNPLDSYTASKISSNEMNAKSRPQQGAQPFPTSKPQSTTSATFVPAYLTSQAGGRPIKLYQPYLVVGRDEGCDITIDGAGVSGRHCEFRCDGQQWTVTDLGSKNGIQINGQSVQSHAIQSGDELTFGKLQRFRFMTTAQQPQSARITWLAIAASLAVGAAAATAWWWFLAR